MHVFTLFVVAGLVLIALTLIVKPPGFVVSGLYVGLLLLPVFEAHSRADFRVAAFCLSLMSVGFLRDLTAWRTQGRPRTAWLGRLLFPGQRVQIASFVLVLGIGGYVLKQSLAEIPPFLPQHGGTCQPSDCSESSDLFCDDACGFPVCLSIQVARYTWTCCTPETPACGNAKSGSILRRSARPPLPESKSFKGGSISLPDVQTTQTLVA